MSVNTSESDMVSIIIVNYNTEKLLKDCLDSIQQKTFGIDYEIIVVDNNSREKSLDSLTNDFPDVKFIMSERNWGFGVANNLGAEYAKGNYLLFLNPDTLLINNAIFELYQYSANHPDVGICGGNMYTGEMKPCSSLYNIDFLALEYQILFNKKRYPGFNYTQSPKQVKVIVGADLFVRKDLFYKLGGFDKDFFMYFEEVELCYRVAKMGYKVVSVPNAEIIHLQGSSAENKDEELSKWSYREHWYSKFVFFSKTKGHFHTKLIYDLYMLKMKAARIFYGLKGNKSKLGYWDIKSDIIKTAYQRYLVLMN